MTHESEPLGSAEIPMLEPLEPEPQPVPPPRPVQSQAVQPSQVPPPQFAPELVAAPAPSVPPVSPMSAYPLAPPAQMVPPTPTVAPPNGAPPAPVSYDGPRDHWGNPVQNGPETPGVTSAAPQHVPHRENMTPIRGIVAGVLVGLGVALAYGLMALFLEIMLLSVLVGGAVGWAVRSFWGRPNLLSGGVAAIIAFFAHINAYLFAISAQRWDLDASTLWPTISGVFDDPGFYLAARLDQHGISLLFGVISVTMALTGGWGRGRRKRHK